MSKTVVIPVVMINNWSDDVATQEVTLFWTGFWTINLHLKFLQFLKH